MNEQFDSPRVAQVLSATAVGLLLVPALIYGAALIAFVAGFYLDSALSGFIAGGALAAATAICMRRVPLPSAIAALSLTLLTLILSVALASQIYDVSYDGQTYHQGTIIALGNGWNPIFESFSGDYVFDGGSEYFGDDPYSQHYPKASWIVGAVIHGVTGSLQAGKAINFVAALAAFCVAVVLFCRMAVAVSWAIVLAAGLALNPIIVSQTPTFYVDGLSASMLTILASGLAMLAWSNRLRDLVIPALAILFVVNLKFSMLVFVLLFCVAGSAALLIRHRRRALQTIASLFVVLLVSVTLFGWTPYMQNLLAYGHPFHPLMGVGAVDIVSINLPSGFEELGRVERFMLGIFGQPGTSERAFPAALGFPFSFGVDINDFVEYYDLRIGGFGPFFLVVILLSLIALAWILRSGRASQHTRRWLLFVLGTIAVSILVLSENWWARYVPQLWFVPIIIAAVAVKMGGTGRYLAALIVVTAGLNAALCAVTEANWVWTENVAIRQQHAELRQVSNSDLEASFGGVIGTWYRLREAGIEPALVSGPIDLRCRPPLDLAGSAGQAVYCRRVP